MNFETAHTEKLKILTALVGDVASRLEIRLAAGHEFLPRRVLAGAAHPGLRSVCQ